jgi:ribulose kinase
VSEALFLGIDVGTGSARAGLFTADGHGAGRGQRDIRIWRTTPDHVEQSSDDIWNAVAAAVADALTQAGRPGSAVRGIGFDATCSLVALDHAGRPVSVSGDGGDERNVVVWMDHRAITDARAINATRHPVLDFVGGTISPEMQTPKLRWLKRELPDQASTLAPPFRLNSATHASGVFVVTSWHPAATADRRFASALVRPRSSVQQSMR